MAIYRNVSLSFWEDNKVVDDFTIEDKYFYLYLLTNPHTNLIGCYEISLKQMCNETGYNRETINGLLDRMENLHKVIFYSKETKEILLKNWSKYNWTKSEKLLKNVENLIQYIKSDILRENMNKILKKHKNKAKTLYPIDTSVSDSVSINIKDNINKIFNNNINNINIFYEYLELRKNNKLSISKTVINDLLNFLDGKDEKTQEKIIKKAIKNNWKDFYNVNDDKKEVKYETV